MSKPVKLEIFSSRRKSKYVLCQRNCAINTHYVKILYLKLLVCDFVSPSCIKKPPFAHFKLCPSIYRNVLCVDFDFKWVCLRHIIPWAISPFVIKLSLHNVFQIKDIYLCFRMIPLTWWYIEDWRLLSVIYLPHPPKFTPPLERVIEILTP